MIHPILRLLYAPDTGGAAAAPAETPGNMTFSVPEVESAKSDTKVEDVDLTADGPAEAAYGVLGPKEAGFGDPDEDIERLEAETEGRPMRERGPDGKFLPKAKDVKKAEDAAKKAAEIPKGKQAAKPAAKVAPKPVAAKAEPKAEPPAKFKIGDEEKTAAEWQAHFAELKTKAETAAKAPEPTHVETPAKTEPKPEEIAAAEQKKFSDFIEREASKYEMPDAELDTILAGGENGRKALARTLAGIEAHTTRRLCESFNKTFEKLVERVRPLLDRDARLSDYERDHGVLEANPEIKDHPKGFETYQKTRSDWDSGEQRIRDAVKAGSASPQEKAWLAYCDTLDPEQKLATIAKITKEELATVTAEKEEPAETTEPAKVVSRSPAVTKPFNGDRPGGGSARMVAETADARALREMTEAGY